MNIKEDEENLFVKILLFPFRLIGMILTGIGKLIYPLIEVLRVAIGVFITFFGLTLMVTVIITIGILVGLISGASVPIHLGVPFNEASLPIEAMRRTSLRSVASNTKGSDSIALMPSRSASLCSSAPFDLYHAAS